MRNHLITMAILGALVAWGLAGVLWSPVAIVAPFAVLAPAALYAMIFSLVRSIREGL